VNRFAHREVGQKSVMPTSGDRLTRTGLETPSTSTVATSPSLLIVLVLICAP
jgi:hypothetical protein